MQELRTMLVVVVTALSIVSCSSSTEQTACASASEEAVAGFAEAMTSGDAVAADSFFADDLHFFSEMPNRVNSDADNRDTVLAYLAQRIADGAHYELATFEYNGLSGNNIGNFGLELRNEDDNTVSGKGAVHCQTGKIIALGLGSPE